MAEHDDWRILEVSRKFPGSFQEVSQSGSCGLLVGRRSGRRGGGMDLLSIPYSFRGDRVRMSHLHTSRHARRTHWHGKPECRSRRFFCRRSRRAGWQAGWARPLPTRTPLAVFDTGCGRAREHGRNAYDDRSTEVRFRAALLFSEVGLTEGSLAIEEGD